MPKFIPSWTIGFAIAYDKTTRQIVVILPFMVMEYPAHA